MVLQPLDKRKLRSKIAILRKAAREADMPSSCENSTEASWNLCQRAGFTDSDSFGTRRPKNGVQRLGRIWMQPR
jgi:hypothetical protein